MDNIIIIDEASEVDSEIFDRLEKLCFCSDCDACNQLATTMENAYQQLYQNQYSYIPSIRIENIDEDYYKLDVIDLHWINSLNKLDQLNTDI